MLFCTKFDRDYKIVDALPLIYPTDNTNIFDRAMTAKDVKQRLALDCSSRTIKRALNNLADSNVFNGFKVIELKPSTPNGSKKYYKEQFVSKNEPIFQDVGINADKFNTNNVSKNSYPERLTDEQVDARILDNVGLCDSKPIDEIKDKIDQIKKPLAMQKQIDFTYEKAKGIESKTVNPIGVVNNRGTYYLMATYKTGKVRSFLIRKIQNININNKNLYPRISTEEVKDILNKKEEHYIFSDQGLVKLIVSKSAADFFASNVLNQAQNWEFAWTNKQKTKAQVSFTHPITMNFIRFLMSYGSSIELAKGCDPRLEKAIAIQNKCDPDGYKYAMAKLFPEVNFGIASNDTQQTPEHSAATQALSQQHSTPKVILFNHINSQ
jgi:hypothetical protein